MAMYYGLKKSNSNKCEYLFEKKKNAEIFQMNEHYIVEMEYPKRLDLVHFGNINENLKTYYIDQLKKLERDGYSYGIKDCYGRDYKTIVTFEA